MMIQPKKAPQTVTSAGVRTEKQIDGVKVHQQVTQQDDRGTLIEIYSPHWSFDDLPLVFAYAVTIRAGQTKGWAVHYEVTDRYFFYQGSVKLVLYDYRVDSPTYGLVNELFFSEVNRSLVLVPPGVYHAMQNIGSADVILINLPSHPYRHEDPDKYTLPLNNDLIPYEFRNTSGQ